MDKKDLGQALLDDNYADTKKNALSAIETIFDRIAAALTAGEEVSIHGFGKFKTVAKPERQCLSPQTGKPITVPAHSVVKFTPAKPLKDAVR